MWRTTPLHRSEVDGELPGDGPPPIPDGVRADRAQPASAGVGPLFHRSYRARIRDARMGAEELVDTIGADLDRVAPSEFASFNKVLGAEGDMAVGDEYVVRMPGPWDGPVRVVERTPTAFRFATLGGASRGRADPLPGAATASCSSSASSPGRAPATGFRTCSIDHLRMSKEVQLHMWTSMLERVAELSGGRLTGGIEIRTRRVDEADAA